MRRIDLDRPVTWVALVGFMGTGKSRIGGELARTIGLHFVDTDKVIERVSHMKVAEVFERFGESTFRAYEAEVVERVVRLDDVVVSCGGGTFMDPENRRRLLERGPVVALWADSRTIYERTRRVPRVLLQTEDPIARIEELLETRRSIYAQAPIQVMTGGRCVAEIALEVVARLKAWVAGIEFDEDAFRHAKIETAQPETAQAEGAAKLDAQAGKS